MFFIRTFDPRGLINQMHDLQIIECFAMICFVLAVLLSHKSRAFRTNPLYFLKTSKTFSFIILNEPKIQNI